MSLHRYSRHKRLHQNKLKDGLTFQQTLIIYVSLQGHLFAAPKIIIFFLEDSLYVPIAISPTIIKTPHRVL